MGTHSYIIMRVDRVVYCKLYQQFDGYLDVVGKKLASFLANIRLVNGFTGAERNNFANGPDCLFAQIVAKFKTEPGYTYLVDPRSDDLEEYNYFVDVTQQSILLTISDSSNEDLFSGSPAEALQFIENYKED